MENVRLHKGAPTSVNGTVGRRSREYLTEREVERLMEAAKQNRSAIRADNRDPWPCRKPETPTTLLPRV